MTDFNTIWNDFVSSFKGELINESRKKKLNFDEVRLIFSEHLASWTSEYEAPGRWLRELSRIEPEKGELVREILLTDMHLDEEAASTGASRVWEYAVPLAAAGAGFGAAKFFGLGTLWTACATAVPAVMLYSIMRHNIESSHESTENSAIEGYVRQLDKYKYSVDSALSA